jgi:hypothetical protein
MYFFDSINFPRKLHFQKVVCLDDDSLLCAHACDPETTLAQRAVGKRGADDIRHSLLCCVSNRNGHGITWLR